MGSPHAWHGSSMTARKESAAFVLLGSSSKSDHHIMLTPGLAETALALRGGVRL